MSQQQQNSVAASKDEKSGPGLCAGITRMTQELSSPNVWRPLALLVVMMVLMMWTGANAVVFYAVGMIKVRKF